MKIYIAAPWIMRGDMPDIARQFEKAGHEITWDWWKYDGDHDESPEFHRTCAINDAQGVINADVLVLLNTSKSEGKAVEQGIAIANGMDIIAVGELGALSKNVFHYMDNYTWVPTVKDAITALSTYEGVDG